MAITTGQAQKVGSPALPLAVADASGKTVDLLALRGKVVLLDFWASWCRPCRQNNAKLKPVYDSYVTSGFEILGISVDTDPRAWQGAVAADQLKWLQSIDQLQSEIPTAVMWQVNFIPRSYLLDKNGVIVAKNPSVKRLNKLIPKLLKR